MGCRPRHLWEIPVKLAALACLAFFLAAFPALGKAGPKADILQLETESNAAYAANDLDKYFAYYSEDAVLWFPEGRTDIPSYKKQWTEYINNGAQIQSCTFSDMHIRFSPQRDAAIASYLLRVKTQEADKTVTDVVYQETDVWFKTAPGWKIAHVHYAQPPPPAHK